MTTFFRIIFWIITLTLVVGLGSVVGADEPDNPVIIIWGDTDQVLVPLGDGFFMDIAPTPKTEYTEDVLPDFYKYPGRGYPIY